MTIGWAMIITKNLTQKGGTKLEDIQLAVQLATEEKNEYMKMWKTIRSAIIITKK